MPDYEHGDIAEPGYYKITYGGNPKPDGPHATIAELLLADYPADGYVVHFNGSVIGMVPSLNPDDLVPESLALHPSSPYGDSGPHQPGSTD